MKPRFIVAERTRRRGSGYRASPRVSAILRRLARENPSLEDIAAAFDKRVFGALFILLGAMNLIPLPPGASLVCGTPLALVAVQLAMGRPRLWLPSRVSSRRLGDGTLAHVFRRTGPAIRRIERMAHHRLWPHDETLLTRLLGAFVLTMAVLVLIPLPLTNLFPGIAASLIGLGMTARDGLWACAGIVFGLVTLVALCALYAGAATALLQAF